MTSKHQMRQNSTLRGPGWNDFFFLCIQISCSQSKIPTMQSSFGINVYFGRNKKISSKTIYDYLHNAHKFAMIKSPWHMDHAHMLTLVVLYCIAFIYSSSFVLFIYVWAFCAFGMFIRSTLVGAFVYMHKTGFKRINLF